MGEYCPLVRGKCIKSDCVFSYDGERCALVDNFRIIYLEHMLEDLIKLLKEKR